MASSTPPSSSDPPGRDNDSPQTHSASTRDNTHEQTPIPLDEVFHVLQNERRRQVLRYLAGVEGPVRMRDVAEQIAAWENDTTVENLYSDERQRVYIALYQSHLPKLDEKGLIEYNQARGIIEPTPAIDDALSYLPEITTDTVPRSTSTDPPWLTAYLTATAVNLVFLGLAWPTITVGLLPISGFGVAALVLTMYVITTLGLLAVSRRPPRWVSWHALPG